LVFAETFHPKQKGCFLTFSLRQNRDPTEKKTEEHTCVEPVSWFSRKVTAREGHHPMTPGGLP